ncbi:tyrosine-type recombinase/integrase [Xanthobacter sediminis]
MASVRKRKWTHNGVEKEAWVVSYTDQGGKRRIKTFDKKKEAERHRVHVESEIEAGTHTAIKETVTIREASEAYLRDCSRRRAINDRVTGETLKSKETTIRTKIVPKFGKKLISEVTSSDIQSWVDDLSASYAVDSIKNYVRDMRQILVFAVSRRWVRRSVLRDDPVRIPKPRFGRKKRIPSIEEINIVFHESRKHIYDKHFSAEINMHAIICLALFSGLRIGEILGLQWEHVDWDANVIRVRVSQSRWDGIKEPKSVAGIRDVPMSGHVRSALLDVVAFWKSLDVVQARWNGIRKSMWPSVMTEYNKQRGNVDYSGVSGRVFKSVRGKNDIYWSESVRVRLKELQERAGVPLDGKGYYTPHSFRHAAVSLLLKQGMPLLPLSQMIGHSKPSVTLDVYGHLFPEDMEKRRAVTAIDTQFPATRE